MDALGGAVGHQLRRGVAGVQLDLVDGGDDLDELAVGTLEGQRVKEHTLQLGSLSNRSRFLMPKLLTPIFRTLPVPTSFCISRQVSTKSQSG